MALLSHLKHATKNANTLTVSLCLFPPQTYQQNHMDTTRNEMHNESKIRHAIKSAAPNHSMSTIKQMKLAHNIVKNQKAKKPLNKRDLIVSSGYSLITAKASPGLILNQPGVIKELNTLGFTEDAAKAVVSEILLDKSVEPSDRLKASDQVFKVHGTYAPEKRISATVDINELQETVKAQIASFRALKQ